MSNHTTDKWEKGDHEGPNGDRIHEAGIHIGEWGQRVQCFGYTKDQAESLRDHILSAVQHNAALIAAIDTVIAQNGLTLLAKEQLLKAKEGAA